MSISAKSIAEIRAAFAERRATNLARSDDDEPDDGMPWCFEVEGTNPRTGEPLTEVTVWPDGSICDDDVTLFHLDDFE